MKGKRVALQMRWHAFRWRLQLAVYDWYRRLRGRPWKYPVIRGGTRFRVTKGIPGFGIRIFGKIVWLTVPMVIEREELLDGDEEPATHNSGSADR